MLPEDDPEPPEKTVTPPTLLNSFRSKVMTDPSGPGRAGYGPGQLGLFAQKPPTSSTPALINTSVGVKITGSKDPNIESKLPSEAFAANELIELTPNLASLRPL